MTQITTKSGRHYEWNGEKFPSVTTILSKGIPKPALIKWAGNMVARIAVEDVEHWMSLSDEEAIAYLAGQPDARRNSSANLGSVIHAAAEAYSKGEEYTPKTPISDKAAAYVQGFKNFVADKKPKFLATEAPVFSRTHSYAGTLDSIVRIGRTNWILDTKTGNRVYPDVALQLAAYSHAEFIGVDGKTEEALPIIKKGAVLHLSENDYQFIPTRIDEEVFEHFLSVKDTYYWTEQLSKVVLRPEIREGRDES